SPPDPASGGLLAHRTTVVHGTPARSPSAVAEPVGPVALAVDSREEGQSLADLTRECAARACTLPGLDLTNKKWNKRRELLEPFGMRRPWN
ncbi:hypothetical protein, partial [Streptomyces sp. NPDC056291]|uniref:hypothetical protein n=1 Tax=Streptomyces sp. NPDC056291 TaxID=3345772 RepID=UPI0035E18868